MSLEKFRSRFPILKKKTYLASHSLGAVPETTLQALEQYYQEWATLGIEAWDGPWIHAMDEFARNIEKVLHAMRGTVALMENATRAMAAVASCLDFRGKRNRIVMTDLEFTTSYSFWRGVERAGAELIIVESEDGISVAPEKICAAIDERTLIVPTAHVYFRSGALQDLEPIVKKAHEHGAYVLGDGYQCIGTVPVDVTQLNIDFYVGGSHKWLCGGPGAGYLYVRKDLIPKLSPKLSGWFGIRDGFSYAVSTEFPLSEGVNRFLGGTVAIPALYAAREGIKTVLEAGLPLIREHSIRLTQKIIERSDSMKLEVRTPREPARRSGMVCIQFKNSESAARALIQRGFVVDWRPNCGIRVSPHFYNQADDIDRFFAALEEIHGHS